MTKYISNQFPGSLPTIKLYSLYEGKAIIIENEPYIVCNAERTRRIKMGIKKQYLHITLTKKI